MDAIGQLNLQLGDVEAQKFQGRSQALGAIRQGVGNVVSDFQKQQVENALAGDFNDIAKSAKEKGVPDTLLTAMAGMWNSAQGRDEKLKIIANLQGIIQAKEEKTKQEKAVEGYRNLPQGYTPADVVKNFVPGTEEAAKIFMSGAMEPVKPKQRTSEEKAAILFGSFAQGKDLVPKAGRAGNQEESRQELINKHTNEFADRLMASGDPDFSNKSDALGYARAVLKNEIKAQVSDKPQNIKVIVPGEKTLETTATDKLTAAKTSIEDLIWAKDNFKKEYLSKVPWASAAEFETYDLGSKFGLDTPSYLFWSKLQDVFQGIRQQRFGQSLTGNEKSAFERVIANPSQSEGVVKGTISNILTKLAREHKTKLDLIKAQPQYSRGILDVLGSSEIDLAAKGSYTLTGNDAPVPPAPAGGGSAGKNKPMTIKEKADAMRSGKVFKP